MKKILFALLGFMVAAPFASADNIKMVTYFPVPYASYGDLGVTGTCDVGLLNNCTLDAGEKLSVYKLSSDSRALNTGSLIANRGVLALNSSKSSSEIATETLFSRRSGGAQVVAPGVLEFAHDLTVDTITGDTIQSGEATNRADLTDLFLFGTASGRRFPLCDAANNKMEWGKLTINGSSGVFLVCGEGAKVEETCAQNPNQAKCCSSTDGLTWTGSSCVRECYAMGSWTTQYNNWYGGKPTGYSYDISTTGGVCPSLSLVMSKTGASRTCDVGEEWDVEGSSSMIPIQIGLTCDNNVLLDSETEFVCAYVSSYAGSFSDCVAGAMKCTRTKETWTCPSTQHCGTTKGTCK